MATAERVSGDEMMDLIAGMPQAKNRCRNMDRLPAGVRGCECCGRPLKAGAAVLEIATDLGMMPFGPECAKAIRRVLEQ
jgi:hypothetical protein